MPSSTKAKARDSLEETAASGEFKRTDSTYRDWISEESATFKPEAGRYHLFVSLACPWAHRTIIVRGLKGLQDVIGVSVVHPTWQRTNPDDPEDQHAGWTFADPSNPPLTPLNGFNPVPTDGTIPDTTGHKFKFVRDIYDFVDDNVGKYTVPVLWDNKLEKIVNNESSEIIKMLNSNFNHLAKRPEVDLDPESLSQAQEEVNSWVYPNINNGVYRAGFARSQQAYEEGFDDVFANLDKAEDILSRHRYLTGDKLTLADVRLWTTLVRFDEVYYVYFKCNKKRIADYPNLLNYMREIYQMPGVAETTNMAHIKRHYYTSHKLLNYYSVVPKGPGVEADLKRPHDRDRSY